MPPRIDNSRSGRAYILDSTVSVITGLSMILLFNLNLYRGISCRDFLLLCGE